MTETSRVPIIAVDGPSGTGKGTICQEVARRLDWHFLDSGALYRCVAWQAQEQGIALDDAAALATLARLLTVEFVLPAEPDQECQVWCAGVEVSRAIRTETCARAASVIAVLPELRAALLDCQRAFGRSPGLVADGRDMGTVVFPDAGLKIFLSASAAERARRRYKQLKEQGVDVNLARLTADIAERDARDTERSTAPLKPAQDALFIDTSDLSRDAVLERVMQLVRDRGW
jgi:CMP/dCMP kinase